jgi:membrane-associated protein
MLEQALDILRHLDVHLATFTQEHGPLVYALLFAIIFAETGLVVLPFLPGDSLLFTVGALAARPDVNISLGWAIALLIIAAILGDFVNYHVGKAIGPRVFRKDADASVRPTLLERMLNKRHLDRAHVFFEKYGGKAVVLGRFVPIVRTFVPFVAGAGAMRYRTFVLYNIVGAVLWIGVCTVAGYLFGNIPWVKKNFEAVVVGIIVVSVLPIVAEILFAKLKKPKPAVGGPAL